ncbi:MAG: AAA family ATPase [Chlorobiales bacterium]|jgi:predicted ATPase|nr:AAA family ATPase [Chlorobiales bacterium]
MSIKTIRVSNFKSFKELTLSLNHFNVLIGANAAGKSNFLQIFKFLRDLAKDGLENAISLQGGPQYLRNIRLGPNKPFVLTVNCERPIKLLDRKNDLEIRSFEQTYTLKISFRKTRYEVSTEQLTLNARLFPFTNGSKTGKASAEIGHGEIVFLNDKGKLSVSAKLSNGTKLDYGSLLQVSRTDETSRISAPIFEDAALLPMYPSFKAFFSEFGTFDFDPKLPKRAIPMTGKRELEEDGSNLALILRHIAGDRQKKQLFSTLIQELLPFVDALEIEHFADNLLFLKLRENYEKEVGLPASFLSDGTINITAMLIALYFEQRPFIVLEEPERNIHPFLISKLVEMMRDASSEKQIITTTHHPEIVRHGGIENLLLITRDKSGFSTISRPAEKETIKTFLKNEIGIEELYIQDLLGL